MAWDIYGEPLKRGHCEVHPWVGDEYPCGICVAERERYEMTESQRRDYEDNYYREQAIEMLSGQEGEGI